MMAALLQNLLSRYSMASERRSSDHTTVGEIMSNLSPDIQKRLDTITEIADILGIDDLAFVSYSSAIGRLSARTLEAQRSLNRLELVEQELLAHLATMVHEEHLIQSWTERLESDEAALENTTTTERRRDALLRKAKEYRAELDSITMQPPPITFAELTSLQASNHLKAESIKGKRAKLRTFKGLPPNLDLARQQLRVAREEQMKLISKREQLLRRMVESVI
ncbi:hypothetical protein C8J57DRAFT_1339557 [Mycena rebaudengoi]|nr:hypothetical protein C8J57DRAFT_1339557 [Mycena rebaudengoi]